MKADTRVLKMNSTRHSLVIRRVQAVLLLIAPFVATASAQEATSSFDALAGRIRVGQQVWVTDAAGREVHGRFERLSLSLKLMVPTKPVARAPVVSRTLMVTGTATPALAVAGSTTSRVVAGLPWTTTLVEPVAESPLPVPRSVQRPT